MTAAVGKKPASRCLIPAKEIRRSMLRLKDGRVCLTYGYRGPLMACGPVLSADGGRIWGNEIILREDGGGRDVGYPRSVAAPGRPRRHDLLLPRSAQERSLYCRHDLEPRQCGEMKGRPQFLRNAILDSNFSAEHSMPSLRGKTMFITGASRGIGKAIALARRVTARISSSRPRRPSRTRSWPAHLHGRRKKWKRPAARHSRCRRRAARGAGRRRGRASGEEIRRHRHAGQQCQRQSR